MKTFFPNFTFEASYAVLTHTGAVYKYDSLDAAVSGAQRHQGTIVGGLTTNNVSTIYMGAAVSSELPIGSASQQQTMRYILLHETGHRPNGGRCGGSESCADVYAISHFYKN